MKRKEQAKSTNEDTKAAAPPAKKRTASSKSAERPGPDIIDDEPHYEVDHIRGHRIQKTADGPVDEYLVAWKGWPRSSDTWEPVEHLEGAKAILRKYLKQL